MKKYTERDVENMLLKTEKTEPSFNKNVSFPTMAVVRRRVRRIGYIMIAACLLIFTLVGSMFVLMNYHENVPGDAASAPSKIPFVSGVSYYQSDDSSYFGGESYAFSEYPDESRTILDDSRYEASDGESVSDAPGILLVDYPDEYEFFIGQGIKDAQTAEEYFNSNPIKHLDAKYKLPVYTREKITFSDRESFMLSFGDSIGSRFEFDQTLFGITGDFRGLAQNGELILNISEYGDWYFYSSAQSFMNVMVTNGQTNDVLLSTVKTFVESRGNLFREGDYGYVIDFDDDGAHISLTCKDRDDPILGLLPSYTFTFKETSENFYSLFSIEHVANGMMQIGEYSTRNYESAVNALFAKKFLGESESSASDEILFEFTILDYDVRYLYSARYSMMCPFYAFAVIVDPYGDNPNVHTVFVPAIEERFILMDSDQSMAE